jgi:hypothetical protein
MIADLAIGRDTAPALSLPLRFIFSAVSGFVLLGLVLFEAPALLGFYFTPRVLTLTHLFTLVFASMAALGALYQLVPVCCASRSPTNGWLGWGSGLMRPVR